MCCIAPLCKVNDILNTFTLTLHGSLAFDRCKLVLKFLYAEPVQSDFLKYFNEINFTHMLFNFVQSEVLFYICMLFIIWIISFVSLLIATKLLLFYLMYYCLFCADKLLLNTESYNHLNVFKCFIKENTVVNTVVSDPKGVFGGHTCELKSLSFALRS